MDFFIKAFIGIILILAFIILSEILVSVIVVNQIPDEMILRESPSAFRSVFNATLILKFFPFIIMSLIIYPFSIRFTDRYLIFAIAGGIIGFLIPWIRFVSQSTEYHITSLNLSSTSALEYLALPVLILPYSLAGILAGLSAMLLYSYFSGSDTTEYYHFTKSRKTCLFEGAVYLILAIALSTGFFIWEHPFRLQEKASSVRTGEKQLEKYYIKANAETDLKLLSSLASNPMLPVHMISEIYNSATIIRSSGDRQYINLFDALARNIKTPGDILSDISLLNNYKINTTIARNPNTPAEVLSVFVKEGSVAMKISVARNPNATAESLSILAGESHYAIRRWVARHKNVTMETLMLLADDTDERVRIVALDKIKKFQK